MTSLARTLSLHRHLGALGDAGDVPRSEFPLLIEVDYAKALSEVAIAPVAKAMAKLRDELPKLMASAARGRADENDTPLQRLERARAAIREVRTDAGEGSKVHAAIAAARGHAPEHAAIGAVAFKYGRRIIAYHADQIRKQVSIGLGLNEVSVSLAQNSVAIAAVLEHWVTDNMTLVRSAATKYSDDVEKLATRAIAAGGDPEVVVRDVADRDDVARRHIAIIARDQTGNLTARTVEKLHAQLGIAKFKWRASKGSARHGAREGHVYSYASPPADGLPGAPVQCECIAEADLDEMLAGIADG